MLSILSIPAPENASAGSPQQSFFYQKVLHLLDNLPFTLSTYTHATEGMKRSAADTIGSVISQTM